SPLCLLAADISNSALAAILTFSDRVLYPTYATVPRIGPSALEDQVLAGVIMWVPGSLPFLIPAAAITIRLLSPSSLVRPGTVARVAGTREPAVTDAPQRGPRRFDLLEAPVVSTFLRAIWFRRALQGVLLALAMAVVLDGLLGHQMGSMNLAGVLPWTYWRGFAVVGLLVAGNVFCFACPFTLPREIGRRLGLATRRWPRALRSKWLAVGLVILFFWAYEAFDIWDRPFWTAWIVIGYFAAALVVDTFFSGASFCKYVCPIGQFHFVNSLVSPLEVKARQPAVCTSCITHDCIRGNDHARGCELRLYIPRKAGNMDCTFCLDCVRACPHDNVGLLAVVPASDVFRDRPRSSVGRYSRRPDLAALALVLVFAAFANAAAMVESVLGARDTLAGAVGLASPLPVTTAGFLVTLVIIPGLLLGTVVASGRALSHATAPLSELIYRFSLALVPLGLAMWVAHFSYHLLSGWASAWPVVQRSAIDVGVSLFGAPRWSVAPLVAADTVLTAQILVLDIGLLLALYVGWRVSRSYARAPRNALWLLMPWAVLPVALYLLGIWTVMQPMQMRGMVH
ncbi:MAG: cytochrome c oxidase assembly protein, partial [Burkholderiales bacterium]